MRRKQLWVSLIATTLIAFGSLVAVIATSTHPQLGLDLQGGASVTLTPVGKFESGALNEVTQIYRSRIDSLGVAEPEVRREGDTIVVDLPGVRNKQRAIDLIGTTGKVVFRPVIASQPVNPPLDLTKQPTTGSTTTTTPGAATTTAPGTATTAPAASGTTAPAATATTASPAQGFAGNSRPAGAPSQTAPPTTPPSTAAPTTTTPGATTTTAAAPAIDASILTPLDQDTPDSTVILSNRDGTEIYQLGPAFALGESAISSASAELQNGEWQVALTLKQGAKGLDAWNQMSKICYDAAYSGGDASQCNGGMAFVLDHKVISAPVPNQSTGGFFSDPTIAITGGQGGFKESEARDLARVLNYGAAPVEMKIESTSQISATLGKGSLHAAVVSGIIGIVLVLLFMLLYYRALALVCVAGVVVSGAIIWSVIALLSRTHGLALTLAGVTGVIVSVGVTIDSYVVFFERLKDEVRTGRTLRSSAQRGFHSAWRTILAADIVSLLCAAVLYQLSIGSVRGFAFFLGLSTACDLAVAYFFTRPAVLLAAQSDRFARGRVLGVRRGEAIDEVPLATPSPTGPAPALTGSAGE
jgi:preprotein translocase subunit SecD